MQETDDDSFLLVSSDIHNDEAVLERLSAVAEDQRCLAFLYAGDLNVENYFIARILKCRNFVFIPVQGNCDSRWDWTDLGLDLPLYRTCTFKSLRVFLTHGHLFYSPSGVGLDDSAYDLVVTGHTHRHEIKTETIDGKRVAFLNPGSPSRPRGGTEASYAVVRFRKDGSVLLEIRALDGDRLLSEEAIPVHKAPVGDD